MREKGFLVLVIILVDFNKDVYVYIKDLDGYFFKFI